MNFANLTTPSKFKLPTNDKIQSSMIRIDDWGFNVFELHEYTDHHPLLHLSMDLYERYGLVDAFQIDVEKLQRFINLVEAGYKENPYVNCSFT